MRQILPWHHQHQLHQESVLQYTLVNSALTSKASVACYLSQDKYEKKITIGTLQIPDKCLLQARICNKWNDQKHFHIKKGSLSSDKMDFRSVEASSTSSLSVSVRKHINTVPIVMLPRNSTYNEVVPPTLPLLCK